MKLRLTKRWRENRKELIKIIKAVSLEHNSYYKEAGWRDNEQYKNNFCVYIYLDNKNKVLKEFLKIVAFPLVIKDVINPHPKFTIKWPHSCSNTRLKWYSFKFSLIVFGQKSLHLTHVVTIKILT